MEDIIKPKVSVVVPCYNVQDYIFDCLNSIVNQTLKELEIIIINDGSTDSTENIIKEFAKKDKRIIFINQKNFGLSYARNKGVEAASGEYISFVDSDDWITPDYLEKLYCASLRNNCDISCSSIIRKGKYKHKYRINIKKEEISAALEDKIKAVRVPFSCYVCGKLFKRELIQDEPFKNGAYFEDVLWLPNILKKAGKLVTVPGIAYYYRVNQNSIVKKNANKKKQRDSYIAKKFIVDFFEENNLVLAEKEKNITKSIKYFLNIPLLKLKEKNFLHTWYLFGFLPVFRYIDFDSHYIFKFFNIRISKRHKSEFEYQKAVKKGTTDKKRTPEIIVSLTSHPKRINFVYITLNTLLNQTLKPDRIVLYLAENEFINRENDLPKSLLSLKPLGVEIKWCPNLYSYKKLVPALKDFPGDIIVTADDDLYYDEDWLLNLYKTHLKYPDCVCAHRIVKMKINEQNKIESYPRDTHLEKKSDSPSFLYQPMGGAGCLYPPNCLYKDIFDSDKFLSLIKTHDDIYFWVMAVLKGTKTVPATGRTFEILPVEETVNSGLCKINNNKGFGMSPDNAFDIITKEYPQIIDIIKNSFC